MSANAAQSAGPPAASVSIGISTGQGWPDIRKYVESLEVAAAAVGADVVIADASGEPPPPQGALAATTRWMTLPRGSVFSARPAMLEACTGDVICLTEDHCLVAPDWALKLRDLHRQYPGALSIGGGVENVADGGAVDWASYFVVQPELLPPVRAREATHLGHANVSYKRAALGRVMQVEGLGTLDSLLQRSLSEEPGAIRLDPAPVVFHDQARSLRYFMRQHFHAGRTFGGFVRANGGGRMWVRLFAAPAVPLTRLVRASIAVRHSRHAGRLQAALPYMLLLLLCQVTGQVTGILFGAGNSPLSVEG